MRHVPATDVFLESSSAENAGRSRNTARASHMKVKWFREDSEVARSNVIRNGPLTQFKNAAFSLGVSCRFFLSKRKVVLEKFYVSLTANLGTSV